MQNEAPSIITEQAAPPTSLWQHVTHANHGPQWIEIAKNQLGYVTGGSKTIYYTNARYTIRQGEIYLLPPGRHYVENTPSSEGPYKETCLTFDNQSMSDAISTLVSLYGLEIRKPNSTRADLAASHVNGVIWPEMELFFESLNPYMDTEYLALHSQMLRLKLSELAYIILMHDNPALQYKMMQCIDRISDPFESIIRDSIFEDLSIEELALRTNKSLTAFKNDFTRIFNDTPHRWIINQRLLHARLLVISTGKAISQIGYDCKFDNTSHFIKLFKREFGQTPLAMRQEHRK